MAISQIRPLWNVPYPRNPYFTGREEILSSLDLALHTAHRVALSQPQGLSGLGGIGKTQTVVEYAYLHREEYNSVLWIRADSMLSLVSSMTELARLLDLPERDVQDQNIIVEAVLRWFHCHSDWLLIYDNIDDLSLAERFLPKTSAGHLLLTTRAHALGGLAQCLDLQRMEPEIGALLLLRRAGLLALQADLNMAGSDEQQLALAISQELDGLPLALDQAGAYIREKPCTLAEYLQLYRQRHHNLLEIRGSHNKDYPASVTTTWSLSFEKMKQANLASAELLNLCAFLAPDMIPEEIFTRSSSYLGNVLAPVASNPILFDLAWKEILRFSLMHRDASTHSFTMHRLVQKVLLDETSEAIQRQRSIVAIKAINNVFPDITSIIPEVKDLASQYEFLRGCPANVAQQCDFFLPHVLSCAIWIRRWNIRLPEATRLRNEAYEYLSWWPRTVFIRAWNEERKGWESMMSESLSALEQLWGEDHLRLRRLLGESGYLSYQRTGNNIDAIRTFLRMVSIEKRVLDTNSVKKENPSYTKAFIRQSFIKNQHILEKLFKKTIYFMKEITEEENEKNILEVENALVELKDQNYTKAGDLYFSGIWEFHRKYDFKILISANDRTYCFLRLGEATEYEMKIFKDKKVN